MAFSEGAFRRCFEFSVGNVAGNLKSGVSKSFFTYATDDVSSVVVTAGYFNPARSRLTVGSIIMVVSDNLATPILKTYVVTAVPASSNVTIALQTTT